MIIAGTQRYHSVNNNCRTFAYSVVKEPDVHHTSDQPCLIVTTWTDELIECDIIMISSINISELIFTFL